MGLDNAERQARWRAKQNAEIERLRKATAEQAEQLAEARREIEIAVLERENATLKMALARERKQHAEAKTRPAKQHAEAKTRAAKPAAPPTEPGGQDPRIAPSDAQAAMRNHLEACGLVMDDNVDEVIDWLKQDGIQRGGFTVQ